MIDGAEFLAIRNEYLASLQAGATEVNLTANDGDAIKHYASLCNGVPIRLNGELLPSLNKGALKAMTPWCKMFVANGEHSGRLIVRDGGAAMFTRLLPGVDAQVTLEVAPECLDGDRIGWEWRDALEELVASIILNPRAATSVPAESEIELHLVEGKVVRTTSFQADAQVKANGVGNGSLGLDPLATPARISVVEPPEEMVKKAIEIIKAVLSAKDDLGIAWQHALELMGRFTGVSDVALERAMDTLNENTQEELCSLVDNWIDEEREWHGFFPRPVDWRYRRDYVVERTAGCRSKTDYSAPRYQRLLRGWDFAVSEMIRLNDARPKRFTAGLLVGDEDNGAKLSEWGGMVFFLVNPEGIRFSVPLGELVLKLRDRAAHVVAHVGEPNHNERWGRMYSDLLERSAPELGKWRTELHWLNSYGASMMKHGG